VNVGLLTTPITFVFALAVMLVLLRLLGLLSLAVKTAHGSGKGKAYACGEDVKDHRIAPDYQQFFPFAFFFTIMHVLVLVVATVPEGSVPAAALGAGYAISLAIGLFVLFRR
jgi:NADH:ubiquinone oxidoreductase subunit 3 (subunit A)